MTYAQPKKIEFIINQMFQYTDHGFTYCSKCESTACQTAKKTNFKWLLSKNHDYW